MRKPRPKGKITFPDYLSRICAFPMVGVQQMFVNGMIESIAILFPAKCLTPGVLSILFSWSLRQGWAGRTGCFLISLWMLVSIEPALSTLIATSPSSSHAGDRIKKPCHCLMSHQKGKLSSMAESHRVDRDHLNSRLHATMPEKGPIPYGLPEGLAWKCSFINSFAHTYWVFTIFSVPWVIPEKFEAPVPEHSRIYCEFISSNFLCYQGFHKLKRKAGEPIHYHE